MTVVAHAESQPEPETSLFPFAYGQRPEDVALLAKHSFLAHIAPRDLGTFLELLDGLTYQAGAAVFREGDVGEHLYFVLRGEARGLRGGAEIARFGVGDHFGETAILGPCVRSMSVVADGALRVARLPRSRLLSLGVSRPHVALHVMQALASSAAASIAALRDDVGLLARQRSLPRRSVVKVGLGDRRIDVGTGTRVGTLLPRLIEGALVVAATVDRRAVSLETPLSADGSVEAMTTDGWEGRAIFRRSVVLLVLEAARCAAAATTLTAGPRVGHRQMMLASPRLTTGAIAGIQTQLDALVARAEPIREEVWAIEEARARFVDQGWLDAAALLTASRAETVTLVACGGTFAIGMGPVLPSAAVGAITLHETSDGLLVDFGPLLDVVGPRGVATSMIPSSPSPAAPARQMADALAGWLHAMKITSVGRFNEACVEGRIDELVRVSEGFHEKNIGRVADAAAQRNVRVVAIAGPSSSGKTTFIRRLEVQLEVNGILPVRLSLDDYYVDRDRTPRDASGELDFESVDALDLGLLRSNIERLIAGERVRVARYDFTRGKSIPEGDDALVLGPSNVLLVEGLHALAPRVGSALPRDRALRVFVHPATALPLDRLSVVFPEDVRLLRRIVRDRHSRGWTARDTIARWPSIRRGEERHVLPFAGEADFVFDSSLVYEIAVLRVFAERYLLEVPREDPAFVTAHRLRQLIDHFVPIYPGHVPRTSLLREFIGGGFDSREA